MLPQALVALTETQKITASGAPAFASFGNAVAIDGDDAVIGAETEAGGGAAYVFRRAGGSWSQTARLTADDGSGNDFFGGAVAISGNVVVVGAPFDDDNGDASGSAYVFTRSGGSWSQTAKLSPGDGDLDDRFGVAVAVSGNVAVISARGDDGNTGSAYVFTRSGGAWSQTAKLTASDGDAQDFFGNSVAVSGTVAVIGSPGDDDLAINSGATYVFTRSGGSWSQTAKLTASDALPGAQFGSAVAVAGDVAIIGARNHDDDGAAYVFTESGGSWTEATTLTASDGDAGDNFGGSVAISGSIAVVGADQDDDDGSSSGSAYVFTESGGSWSESAKLTASDAAQSDGFGRSVGVSGTSVMIGAPNADNFSGAAYAFDVTALVTLAIAIDIQPDDDDNVIGGRRGVIVVIESQAGFKPVQDVKKSSLRFGKDGDENSLHRCGTRFGRGDYNGDGVNDLVCSFEFADTGLGSGDTTGKLSGETRSGTAFAGDASVTVRAKKKNGKRRRPPGSGE